MSTRAASGVGVVAAAALPAVLWHGVVADIASEFRPEPAYLITGWTCWALMALGLACLVPPAVEAWRDPGHRFHRRGANWNQPLVWLVVAILAVGLVIGTLIADARSPSYALGSELVYGSEIGAVTVGAMLFVLTTLRLASYHRTFTSFGAGPLTTEADDPASATDAAVVDVEATGARVDALAEVVAKLLERVDALERRRPSAESPR